MAETGLVPNKVQMHRLMGSKSGYFKASYRDQIGTFIRRSTLIQLQT